MSEPVGYVLLEWNQASGMPDLAFQSPLYETREYAESEARFAREHTKKVGRHERYTVAEVRLLEEPS